jgi:hypothetical protein
MTDNHSEHTARCEDTACAHSDMLLNQIKLVDKQLDSLQQDYVLLWNHYNNMRQDYAEWRKQLMIWSAASIVSLVTLAAYMALLLLVKG